MDRFIKEYINRLERKEKRKSFLIDDLEKHIISRCGGYSSYQGKGGYAVLYNSIKLLEKQHRIKELKTVGYNGQNPPLKIRWAIIQKDILTKWSKEDMLRVSDLLDLSQYNKNPNLQTDKEWQYINNIYEFLKNKESRFWASCEERCLELFNDEKFMDSNKKDNEVLKRLNISYDDLKMKKYGHMFVYWNRGTPNIEKIIILENHSTFFSYKRAAMEGKHIFGIIPDALIYGEGKKIIKSFSFLEEIADIKRVEALYFGDIDPEGFMIYRLLKEKYKEIDISLQLEAYITLLSLNKFNYPCEGQSENEENLNYVLEELYKSNRNLEADKIMDICRSKYRIPQELITYEYLMGL